MRAKSTFSKVPLRDRELMHVQPIACGQKANQRFQSLNGRDCLLIVRVPIH